MSDNIKNIIERAVKTFVEAFISTLLVGLTTFDYNTMPDKKKIITILLLPAIATALSAMWNFIQSKAPKDTEVIGTAEITYTEEEIDE